MHPAVARELAKRRPLPQPVQRRCVGGLYPPTTRASSSRVGLLRGNLFKHYDGRNLTVFGKGGKVRYLPVARRVPARPFSAFSAALEVAVVSRCA